METKEPLSLPCSPPATTAGDRRPTVTGKGRAVLAACAFADLLAQFDVPERIDLVNLPDELVGEIEATA